MKVHILKTFLYFWFLPIIFRNTYRVYLNDILKLVIKNIRTNTVIFLKHQDQVLENIEFVDI